MAESLEKAESDLEMLETLFRLRFLEKFQLVPENMSSQLQSIYRIPSLLRDLDPKAYEPRVVSIGPYHHGKEQLREMEEHKHRALQRFLIINDISSLDFILAQFREPNFLEEVRKCYRKPLDTRWLDDDLFSRLMVLDGCFLLELLFGTNYPIRNPSSSINDGPEKHALLSYVNMDMLVLENQIPLFVLRKLASIIANLPTRSENVAIQVENQNITKLIWKFYGAKNDEIPANLLDDAHHVLDAYWRKGCIDIEAYNGWLSRESAKELKHLGIRFRPSSSGSFTDVKFDRDKNNFIRRLRLLYSESPRPEEPSDQSQRLLTLITASFSRLIRSILVIFLFLLFWWWYRVIWVAKGTFSLPHRTINGATGPTLLNLMAFERLHLRNEKTHPVTNYVSLMVSLVRSQDDAKLLRKKLILSCSPGWTDESVVKLFADLSRNVAFDETKSINRDIDGFLKQRSVLRRIIWSDYKTKLAWLSFYGVFITLLNTCISIIKQFIFK